MRAGWRAATEVYVSSWRQGLATSGCAATAVVALTGALAAATALAGPAAAAAPSLGAAPSAGAGHGRRRRRRRHSGVGRRPRRRGRRRRRCRCAADRRPFARRRRAHPAAGNPGSRCATRAVDAAGRTVEAAPDPVGPRGRRPAAAPPRARRTRAGRRTSPCVRSHESGLTPGLGAGQAPLAAGAVRHDRAAGEWRRRAPSRPRCRGRRRRRHRYVDHPARAGRSCLPALRTRPRFRDPCGLGCGGRPLRGSGAAGVQFSSPTPAFAAVSAASRGGLVHRSSSSSSTVPASGRTSQPCRSSLRRSSRKRRRRST